MKTDSASIQEGIVNMVDDTHSSEGAARPLTVAGQRLSQALDCARQTFDRVQEQTVAGARSADQVVRNHPYHVIGAAFGLGALLGLLIRGRK